VNRVGDCSDAANGLAYVNQTRHDDTGYRRTDHGVVQIPAVAHYLRLSYCKLRLAAFSTCTATSRSCLVTYSWAKQPARSIFIGLGQIHRGLGTGKIRLALLQLRPIQGWIKFQQNLTCFDFAVKVA